MASEKSGIGALSTEISTPLYVAHALLGVPWARVAMGPTRTTTRASRRRDAAGEPRGDGAYATHIVERGRALRRPNPVRVQTTAEQNSSRAFESLRESLGERQYLQKKTKDLRRVECS